VRKIAAVALSELSLGVQEAWRDRTPRQRRKEPARSRWPWALLLVVAGAAFWRLIGNRGIISDGVAEAA
jgi:hypothetical protein